MVIPRRETLVLTLTSDPALARLARRVALHFFLQNGINRADSRNKARIVERRCKALLRSGRPEGRKAAGARGQGSPLILTLVSGSRRLEVFGRRQGGTAGRRVLGFARPGPTAGQAPSA
jgi:hypothetical protein